MNTFILMAEVIANPELRKTTDNLDVANMMVEFPGLRDDEPNARIRVVGWGKLGVEMSETYGIGDRVVIEGRLSMNLIEKDGYKEKRAELVASHIYTMGQKSEPNIARSNSSNVVNLQPLTPEPELDPTPQYASSSTKPVNSSPEDYNEGTLDEIPF